MNSYDYSMEAVAPCENFDDPYEISAEELEREFEEMDRIARMPRPEPDHEADFAAMAAAFDCFFPDDDEVSSDAGIGDNEVNAPGGNEVKTSPETAQISAISSGEDLSGEEEASLVEHTPSFLETPLPPPSTTPSRTSSRPKSPSPKRWKDYTEKERCIAFNEVVMRSGGVGFTLNLGHSLHDKALAAPLGFSDFMRRRIARRLDEHLNRRNVDYWFALDVTSAGRVHIHGGIVASLDEHDRVTDALKLAGGAWEGRGCHGHQVVLTGLQDSGWASYAARNLKRACRRVTGDRPVELEAIAASKGMRTAAAALVACPPQAV